MKNHASNIVDAVPRLLESALQSVTEVFLRCQDPCIFRSPQLGTLGGAGNMQTATRFFLELVGLNPNQYALLVHAIQHGTPAPGQIRLKHSSATPPYHILNLQFGDIGKQLVVVAQSAGSLPPAVLEIDVHTKTFVWRIATQRH